MCPEGSFIYGAQVRYYGHEAAKLFKFYDDVALSGLKVFCKNPVTLETSEVMVEEGANGEWK